MAPDDQTKVIKKLSLLVVIKVTSNFSIIIIVGTL